MEPQRTGLVEVRHAHGNDIGPARALVADAFGAPNDPNGWPRKDMTLFVAADDTGNVVGTVTTRVIGPGQYDYDALRARLAHLPDRIGFCGYLAVAPEWRRSKIGLRLKVAALDHLARVERVTHVAGAVWSPDGGEGMAVPLLRRFGFRPVDRVPGHWKAASTDPIHGWRCTTCHGACECTAELWLLAPGARPVSGSG